MWIKCNAIFLADTDVDYDSLGIKAPEDSWEEFCFDLIELESFNESTGGVTTIGFRSGNRMTIDIKYNEFRKIIFNGKEGTN